MKLTLKQELIKEIMRTKWNPYSESELDMLNEFVLQSILQDLILEGDNYVYQDISEWTHVRNQQSVRK